MKRIIRAGVAFGAVGVLVLAGCSSDEKSSDPTTTTTTGGGAATGIIIEGFAFKLPASVKAGTAIDISNLDGARHTFTDRGGAFSVEVDGNGSSTVTIEKAGTYSVTCQIHDSMSGTLTVA